MICNLCKKEYKKESRIFKMFGTEVCLHDDKIKLLESIGGMSIKNDSVTGKVARSGKNATEERYIQNSKKRGSTVVRDSNGLLREVGFN